MVRSATLLNTQKKFSFYVCFSLYICMSACFALSMSRILSLPHTNTLLLSLIHTPSLLLTLTPNRDVDASDGAGSLPPNIIGLKGVPAEERPLVHVFAVQESMPLDALMAVSCERCNLCMHILSCFFLS